MTSDGTWHHITRDGTPESQATLGEGSADSLTLGPSRENRLTVLFNETGSLLFINNELIAAIDLSDAGAQAAGDVRLMTGINSTDTYDGSAVLFYDLTIYTVKD